MNVTCTGCPAKYAVPDEKVRGKKVRITCKHCGTNIVVDGSALGGDQNVLPKPAAEPAPLPAAASAPDLTSAAPAPVAAAAPKAASAVAPEATFIVGFLDDRQEPHTLSQIVEMYRSGQIDDDVLVWKDGMADWLSPFDVPEVATAMLKRGVTRKSASTDLAAATDEEQTLIARSPFEDPELAAAAPAPLIAPAPLLAAALAPHAFGASKPAAQPMFPPAAQPAAAAPAAPAAATATPAPKAAAARRAEPRGGAVDLFGSVAEAGGENDSSLDFGSSAPDFGSAAADEPAHKLTGARNESSVLFSLDALTKPEAKANQKQKERDKEQEASAALFGESAPNSLMNVGGGGLAALAAPDFTKPVSATVEPLRASPAAEVYDTTPPNKKKGGWVLLLGSLFGIAAVAGGAFVMMKKQPFAAPAATPSAEMPAATSSAPSAEATAASAAAEASASAAPSTEASTAGAAATAAAAGGAPVAAAAVNKPAGEKKPEAAATAATPATPAAPATTAAPAPAPAPAADGAAFDKNAAVAALGAAAANAGSCKKPDGPTGSGKVSVTFAPSGRATATSVAGELAGTEVGGCVARLFRSAKVPPFSGDPVTVSKSFSVQ